MKLGEFATLADGLDYAASGVTGFNFYSARGSLEHTLTYSELRLRSLAVARKLIALGLRPLDRVAVVAETGPQFLAVFFGCQYAGLVPCPMPCTMHIGGRDSYVARIAGMLASVRASLAIAPDDLAGHIGEAASKAGTPRVLTFTHLAQLPERDIALDPFRADDIAYIQYSSGSTASPKGVLISQKAICTNTAAILHRIRVVPGDRCLSWLPLYHDMGLVGLCLSPLMGQTTVDFLATASFARRPALWLRLLSENRCTISSSPSFGYDLAARRLNGDAKTLDLSCWRVAGVGGDMVRADILHLFAEKLEPAGFRPRAFVPCYGMAEATLAVAIAGVDQPMRIDAVDRARCKRSQKAVPANHAPKQKRDRVRNFVVCGKPLPGHEVVIRNPNGRRLKDREIGHIHIKGPSMMTGYFENDEATSAVFTADGFMDTGDMGYWLDGEIVVTGRAKDLILHNGCNIWPEDIEWAAEQTEPLRDGDAAAFALEGPQDEDDVIILVHCRLADCGEMEDLRRRVVQAVHRSAGVDCTVVLVLPKSLPFTSSGKLSRAEAKRGYLSGEIAEVRSTNAMPSRPLPDSMLLAAAE